jgi:hypothetical protein
MREDRKKGLLLIDRKTLKYYDDHFRRFLLLNTNDLIIGIITEANAAYSDYHIPDFIRRVSARKMIMPYANSLLSSVASRIDVTDLNVMCLSTSDDLIEEAHQLSWGAIKVPNVPGELSRSHLMDFRKTLDAHLQGRDASNSFTLVISLDIDETIFFYTDSCLRNRTILNKIVLDFLKDIIEKYKDHPLTIKLVVVTARDKAKDKIYHRQGSRTFSVERVMAEFSKAIAGFFQGEIPVFYTCEKYAKLGELHGSKEDTLVLHLDDNPDWTNAFNLEIHRNIRYASVHSPARRGLIGHSELKAYPEFVFPEDEQLLLQWCKPFTTEDAPKSPAVSSTIAFFPAKAQSAASKIQPAVVSKESEKLPILPAHKPAHKSHKTCTML